MTPVTTIHPTHLARWSGLDGLDLIRVVLTDVPGRVGVSSSFGAEAAVLLDLVARVDPATPVIFADTGRLFAETLDYRDRLTVRLGLSDLRTATPDPVRIAAQDGDGTLHASDHDSCCWLRKVEPFLEAIADFDVVITGRKRFHGAERDNLLPVETTATPIRINPLAKWSEDDIHRYMKTRKLPPHPLVARGYRSIGCDVCTRGTRADEAVRAGRWSGFEKTECGIHQIISDGKAQHQ